MTSGGRLRRRHARPWGRARGNACDARGVAWPLGASTLSISPIEQGRDGLARVADWWRGLTPRERLLVRAAGGAALAVAVFLAAEAASDARAELANLQQQRSEAQQALREARRARISAGQREAMQQTRGLLLAADTLSLARLQVEQRLVSAAERAGAAGVSVKVADRLEGPRAAPLLTAEISGPYTAASFKRLLADVVADPQAVQVRAVEADGLPQPPPPPPAGGVSAGGFSVGGPTGANPGLGPTPLLGVPTFGGVGGSRMRIVLAYPVALPPGAASSLSTAGGGAAPADALGGAL